MQNLIQFIIRYSYLGLFLCLQIICFALIVRYNQSQKEIWINSTHLYTSKINEESQKVKNYFRLSEINDSLRNENAALLEQIVNYKVYSKDNAFQNFLTNDSLPYQLIPAPVSSKTVGYRNNFFTISKGNLQGIHSNMGVLSGKGIVGTVIESSDHFAKIMLVCNAESQISAAIKGKGFFGNLKWSSDRYTEMDLVAIPKFANISIGDTIVTSGFSTLFPPNITIGRIKSFEVKQGSSNFNILVELNEDITVLNHVYVVDFAHRAELDSFNLNQILQ
jgi:rod shape-determining protein MreC